jgi:glucose-6-phosphate isomerase/transaldolase/glucose-6-phosphate isomerase
MLTYLRPSAAIDAAIRAFRKRILSRYHVATTAGYGPRYLHSTGQLHKGGTKDGVFLEFTEAPSRDVNIPGTTYTFGTLAQAQAVGDVQSLESHGRPVIQIDLGKQPVLRIAALLSTRKRPSRSTKGETRKSAQPKGRRSRGRRA